MNNLILALYVVTTSSALVTLKLGSTMGEPVTLLGKIQFNINLYTILGILLYGISFLLYIYLISKFDLGYIIPLATGLVYILIFISSFIIFKESFTLVKIISICMIIGGVVLLHIGK